MASAPNKGWLPDDAVKNCVGCSKAWSFSRRKHHCRACGRLFCGDCSNKRVSLGKLKSQRACEYCWKVESKRSVFVNAAPFVKAGSTMLRHNRFSSDSQLVRMCASGDAIELVDQKSHKLKDSFALSAMASVATGKTTTNLKRANKVSAMQCFAVICAKKTFELECGDKKTRDVWVQALQAKLFVDKQVDPKELGQKAREQYQATQYDKAKTNQFAKNQKKRDHLRRKYKLDK